MPISNHSVVKDCSCGISLPLHPFFVKSIFALRIRNTHGDGEHAMQTKQIMFWSRRMPNYLLFRRWQRIILISHICLALKSKYVETKFRTNRFCVLQCHSGWPDGSMWMNWSIGRQFEFYEWLEIIERIKGADWCEMPISVSQTDVCDDTSNAHSSITTTRNDTKKLAKIRFLQILDGIVTAASEANHPKIDLRS